MRFSFLRKIFFGVGFCLWFGFLMNDAQAFEVRPAIIDISIPVGSSTEREIRVYNDEAIKKELFFTVQKFVADGSGSPRFLDPKDVVGLPMWLRVSSPQIVLGPKASGSVRVHIDVPSSAEPGGHYVGVFTTERATGSGSAVLGKRIATLLLVNVAGDQAPARMELVKGVQKYASHRGDVEATVKNTGKTHGFATVKTIIRRWTLWGIRKEEDVHVVRLLPGESRKVTSSWEDGLSLTFSVQTQIRIEETGAAITLSGIEYEVIGGCVFAVFFFAGMIVFFVRRNRRS